MATQSTDTRLNGDRAKSPTELLARLGYQPLDYQLRTWRAMDRRRSGIIVVPTGSGKTFAATLWAMVGLGTTSSPSGLGLLYVTPLRAVAHDIARSLGEANQAGGLQLSIEERTGDTSSYRKKKQLAAMPQVLITTPESLSLMLSHPGAAKRFASLRMLVLDEWHELMASKRGVLAQLSVSRLKRLPSTPPLVWALSATIGDPAAAAETAVGVEQPAEVITAELSRAIHLEPLLPDTVDSFPWGGHLGMAMRDRLVERLHRDRSTLIFTNTRNQAERWYTALVEAAPEMAPYTAVHHGSIDGALRGEVEARLRRGELYWVVATSSLDLGIDFRPVEEVVQIGSVKGIARLVQRAGRSGHTPGMASRILLVPTNTLELVELLAVQRGLERRVLEPRETPRQPVDVLLQHLLTLAAGDGLDPSQVWAEVRTTVAYRDLSWDLYQELVAFLRTGGTALSAYERYRKLEPGPSGLAFHQEGLRRLHRMNIGTITANPQLTVAFKNGTRLGEIEESFVRRLRKGDVFFFAGHRVEYVMLQDTTLRVRRAGTPVAVAPSWPGGRLPISESLGNEMRAVLASLGDGGLDFRVDWCRDVVSRLEPILTVQRSLSALPSAESTLVEHCSVGRTQYLFVFPFQGVAVHQGIAAVLATRIARRHRGSYLTGANDYGLVIRTTEPIDVTGLEEVLRPNGLKEDLEESLNLSDLARREFREIARIAGLVLRRQPGHEARLRQVQASSDLLFDVFAEFDRENPLYREAFRAVLSRQLDVPRLARTMRRLTAGNLIVRNTSRPSPLAFPLFADTVTGTVTTETGQQRLERLIHRWSAR